MIDGMHIWFVTSRLSVVSYVWTVYVSCRSTNYCCVRMRSCINGELCVVFCLWIVEFTQLVFTCLFALCTDFTMFSFASHIFLLYLVRYVLTSRTFWHRVCSVLIQLLGRFLTVCISFQVVVAESSSEFFRSVILLLQLYSLVSLYVACVVSMLLRVLNWCLCRCGSWSLCWSFVVFSEYDCKL